MTEAYRVFQSFFEQHFKNCLVKLKSLACLHEQGYAQVCTPRRFSQLQLLFAPRKSSKNGRRSNITALSKPTRRVLINRSRFFISKQLSGNYF